jgi:hypothetical protein
VVGAREGGGAATDHGRTLKFLTDEDILSKGAFHDPRI